MCHIQRKTVNLFTIQAKPGQDKVFQKKKNITELKPQSLM